MAQIISFPHHAGNRSPFTTRNTLSQESIQTILNEELKDYNFMLEGVMSGMMTARARLHQAMRNRRLVRRAARSMSIHFTPTY